MLLHFPPQGNSIDTQLLTLQVNQDAEVKGILLMVYKSEKTNQDAAKLRIDNFQAISLFLAHCFLMHTEGTCLWSPPQATRWVCPSAHPAHPVV